MFGDDLLVWLVLALGAAMVVGNLGAVIRPRAERRHDGDLEEAPLARSLMFAGLGAVATVWALASLLGG